MTRTFCSIANCTIPIHGILRRLWTTPGRTQQQSEALCPGVSSPHSFKNELLILVRNDYVGALMLVLGNAPYGPNVEEAKVRPGISSAQSSALGDSYRSVSQNLNLQTLVSILNSTKATDIPGIVKALSPDAQDALMKYLYKGMALPGWGDVSGSVLLGWHEKVRTSLSCVQHFLTITATADGSSGDGLHRPRDDGQKACVEKPSFNCTLPADISLYSLLRRAPSTTLHLKPACRSARPFSR